MNLYFRFAFIVFNILPCMCLLNNNIIQRQVAHKMQTYFPTYDKKIYVVDIDGTICTKTNSDYFNSQPIYENIDVFNSLYRKGHEIHYWTSRGALSGKNWDKFTVYQLNSWGVEYNTINMGKPHYDLWIDDRAINAGFFCKN